MRGAAAGATIGSMTTPFDPRVPVPPDDGLRASDAEREAVASRVRTAVAEGRLTVAEADERQTVAYAALTRAELAPLTADLPDPRATHPTAERPSRGPLSPAARQRLAVHAIIVGVLAVFLVTRWLMDPAPWFWPAWPMLWLGLSVLVHHRIAARAADRSPGTA
jgi:uncharacterized protein DUF1707